MSKINEPATVWSSEVENYADVVSWFPSPFTDTFLCGQYELIESSDKRVGGITVYKVKDENCEIIQNIPSAGVLDVRWLPTNDHVYLTSALSDGKLAISTLDPSNGLLNEAKYLDASHKSSIIMSLDNSELNSGMVATCDTLGYLTLQNVFESVSDSQNISQWQAHDFEIWAVAFDKHDPNRIFSGGDDCSLKCWDYRTDLSKAAFQSKQHSMGVTSITISNKTENHLFSGSYDELIKHWDCRNMKKCLKEVHVGGGVWRLRWNSNEDILVAACMHNGVKVLNSDFVEIASYSKHKSMAYGVDIKCSETENSVVNALIVSCSFYDKALHFWKLS